jgi:hypothetical protein
MPTKGVAEPAESGAASPLTSGTGTLELPAALRLQILTTEHWSLLSTRALSWNETSSRTAAFLAALSGAVVALALVAQATAFGDGFVTFALLILPVVLFIGVTTFFRLVEINHEDVRWVIGMNLLRHAYLEAAPELRPYFITGWHDDEAGIMATFAARAGPGAFCPRVRYCTRHARDRGRSPGWSPRRDPRATARGHRRDHHRPGDSRRPVDHRAAGNLPIPRCGSTPCGPPASVSAGARAARCQPILGIRASVSR